MTSTSNRIVQRLIDASEGALDNDLIHSIGEDISSLGLNSLTVIRWIVLLEEEFDIEIDLEEVMLTNPIIWSLPSLIDYIDKVAI